MNLLPRWMWMTNEAMRQQEAVDRELDPGDMGTAFGLDATFAAVSDESAAGGQPEADWHQRLERRPRR